MVDRLEVSSDSHSMTTGGSKAADAFLFASLTALSANWPCRDCMALSRARPGQHQRVRCTANPRVVEKSSRNRGRGLGGQGPQPPLSSTLVITHGYAHACPSTWAPTCPSRGMFSQLKIVQVYSPITGTSPSDEETDNFYNTIDNILEKRNHCKIIVMKTANARNIDRKNITRTVWQFTEVKLRKLLQNVIGFVYQMVCNGILNELSDNTIR